MTHKVTIITGFQNGVSPELATTTALSWAAIHEVCVTLTHGEGYTNRWGREPVLVITAYTVGNLDKLRKYAADLRWSFKQDSVLFGVEEVTVPEFV